MQHLLLDLFHTDDAGNKQTGRNRCDRHHDRIRQEIKEIKELHTDELHPTEHAIAKGG